MKRGMCFRSRELFLSKKGLQSSTRRLFRNRGVRRLEAGWHRVVIRCPMRRSNVSGIGPHLGDGFRSMPREDAATKGLRYLTEGRLTIAWLDGRKTEAVCLGDSAEYYGARLRPGRMVVRVSGAWTLRAPDGAHEGDSQAYAGDGGGSR
jgi:hypothetical protein